MREVNKTEPLPPTDAERIIGLQAAVARLAHENDLLKTNANTHENNRDRYEKNTQGLKDQIADLQARLIASQDRIRELQDKLLSVRAAVY